MRARPSRAAHTLVTPFPAARARRRLFNTTTVKDQWGRPVLLFRNAFALQQVEADAAGKLGELSPYAQPPEK